MGFVSLFSLARSSPYIISLVHLTTLEVSSYKLVHHRVDLGKYTLRPLMYIYPGQPYDVKKARFCTISILSDKYFGRQVHILHAGHADDTQVYFNRYLCATPARLSWYNMYTLFPAFVVILLTCTSRLGPRKL